MKRVDRNCGNAGVRRNAWTHAKTLRILEGTMNFSRRHLFQTTAMLAGTIASVAVVPIALAQTSQSGQSSGGTQVSKQAAQYQDKPNGQQSCAACANFQPPSTCVVVSGAVAPNGWCKLFKAKGS